MEYRHEIKHEINLTDLLVLRARLSAVMKPDVHSPDGKYNIRSLYFDTPEDKALREKRDGVNIREKFRIRLYNGDTSFIALEKKGKKNGLCTKETAVITEEEARALAKGDFRAIRDDPRSLCREFASKSETERLRPKTIVDYTRQAFFFDPGNIRVTIDYDIRTGEFRSDLFDRETVTLPAGDPHIILEVKWGPFLPDVISDAVRLNGRMASAFSKYEKCRIYG